MINRAKLLSTAWEAWRVSSGEPSGVMAIQQARLAEMIEFARQRSRFYQRLYNQLPAHTHELAALPPVTKSELMASFDDWVTDPAITCAGLEAHVADEKRIGQPYLGRYAAWHTSGVTGVHTLFVHDGDAVAVYAALMGVRGVLEWLSFEDWQSAWQTGGNRTADVLATGGHHASFAFRQLGRQISPWLARDTRTFSVLTPLPRLVQELNEFQPTMIVSYPTVMELLVHEQAAGRLAIKPTLIMTGAEGLTPAARDQIAAVFHCPVQDSYAAAEFMGIAFDCEHGHLHVNADWVILEPVDEAYKPVPPGQASHTVLLTNLVNRVQPIIRYDLGDSITLSPAACPCGSPLPTIRVEGRAAEILTFQGPQGQVIRVSPLALGATINRVSRVRSYQVIQTTPAKFTVRLEPTPGADLAQVSAALAHELHDYLSAQGAPFVEIELTPGSPRRDPATGKLRRVWVEPEARVGRQVGNGSAPRSAS